nr:helix-turn-helix transcriptional regulator [Bacteroidota bacterium]
MHFLPFLLVLSLNTWLAKNTSSYEVRHTLMMFQFLIYIVVSLELLIKSFFTIEVDHRKTYIPNYFWLGSILLAVFLIWLTFLLHNLFNLFDNIVGPVLYSFIVYIMLYLAFTKRGFEIMEAHKKKKPVLSQEESKEIFKILLTEFTDRKVFTDTELTVTKLAKCIYTQPYKLSKAINEQSGRNFSDFINYYRVEEAKRMLKHKKFINYKITAIAYDCGFNSFSAFSAAFKKFTGLTPSRYK